MSADPKIQLQGLAGSQIQDIDCKFKFEVLIQVPAETTTVLVSWDEFLLPEP